MFALAALTGCSSEDTLAPVEGAPGGRVPDVRESGGGRGNFNDAGDDGDDVRVFLDGGNGVDPSGDSGGTATDVSGGPPVEPGDYREVTIEVPASGFTTTSGTHFESDYGISKPDLTCTRNVGPVVFADVFRLTTTSTTPVQAQVLLRTGLNTEVLTLPDAMLLQYSADVRPGEDSVMCSANGSSTATSTSALASVTVSASAPVLLVVAGQSPGIEGSYNLLVGRAGEAEPPLTGGGGGGGGGGGETGFMCIDGTSIPDAWVCDGAEDCLLGDDELGCGGGGGGGGCDDSCLFALDGACDEGGAFAFCETGTDCSDCGGGGGGGGGGGCTDSCLYAFDGMCDDGGAGSETSVCTLGTDCGDCGPR